MLPSYQMQSSALWNIHSIHNQNRRRNKKGDEEEQRDGGRSGGVKGKRANGRHPTGSVSRACCQCLAHSHIHTVYFCPASLPQGIPHTPRRMDHIHQASVSHPGLSASHKALLLLGRRYSGGWWLCWWRDIGESRSNTTQGREELIPCSETQILTLDCRDCHNFL